MLIVRRTADRWIKEAALSVNWLLTGLPGIGKTTAVESVIARLPGFNTTGFVTREIRRDDSRTGFEVVDTAGRRQLLASVALPSRPRVGRYGVDLRGFERFIETIPFQSTETDLILIDEIGKMECLSKRFRRLVGGLLDRPIPVLATVARYGGGLIEAVKRRPDIILREVRRTNRNRIPDELARDIRLAVGRR
jgi:nucleoside-triphosphatase